MKKALLFALSLAISGIINAEECKAVTGNEELLVETAPAQKLAAAANETAAHAQAEVIEFEPAKTSEDKELEEFLKSLEAESESFEQTQERNI